MARAAKASAASQGKPAVMTPNAKGGAAPKSAKANAPAPAPVLAKAARSTAPLPVPAAKAAKSKASVSPPPPTKAVTVTLKHLAANLSERRGLTKREAETIASELVADLVDQMKAGARVRIAGLGVLEIKDRPARMARNPATGASVQVAASRKVLFRVAKDLKESI